MGTASLQQSENRQWRATTQGFLMESSGEAFTTISPLQLVVIATSLDNIFLIGCVSDPYPTYQTEGEQVQAIWELNSVRQDS